jgi:hypothetical protein
MTKPVGDEFVVKPELVSETALGNVTASRIERGSLDSRSIRPGRWRVTGSAESARQGGSNSQANER